VYAKLHPQPFYRTIMKIGYARVSTKEQNLSLQMDALEKEGCKQIFQEKIGGAKADRPQLRKMIEQLREGDVIITWKLDRLGRSLRDLVNLVNEIQDKGAGLKSLNDSIDTTTPQGKLTFHFLLHWQNLRETLFGSGLKPVLRQHELVVGREADRKDFLKKLRIKRWWLKRSISRVKCR
jgi:hypothetical protein